MSFGLKCGLLLLLLSTSCAQKAPEETVTFSLRDYTNLYRRAELKDLQRQMSADQANLEKENEALLNKLRNGQAERQRRREVLPQNWQLLSHEAQGECQFRSGQERAPASYNFTLEFRVFEDDWTAIRLIDAQTIVTNWSISRRSANHSEGSFQEITLGSDTFLMLQPREEAKDVEAWEDHSLVTNVSGIYRISFQTHSHVRSNRQLQTLQLNLLHPISETQLRLGAENGHIREISVEPTAHWEAKEAANFTDLKIYMPSTRQMSLKWRVVPRGSYIADEPGTESPPETQVEASVVHDILHSVDESILHTLHSFKYVLDSEQSLNKIEIHFPGRERITSVVAQGMTNWKSVPRSANATAKSGSILQVAFKSSAISKEVVILVTTELSTQHKKRLQFPTAHCQRVLRQSGTIAVVKLANIELHQEAAVGAARLGIDQVPLHMSSKAGKPIILAYKFMAPTHAVDLSVIHHEEMNTLESVVDAALYKVLVVDDQVMHNLLLNLQNTQRQYMAVQGIDPEATIWTAKVNSVSSKLALRDGQLLVPLQVAGGGFEAKSSVEISWVQPLQLEPHAGVVQLKPPRLDMPMAALSMEVWFPADYEVNFTTSLRQVEAYSQRQPSAVNYETGKEVVDKDFDFASAPRPKRKDAGVQSKMPKAGSRWRFEQLLVVDGKADLKIAYQKPEAKTDDWLTYLSKICNVF